MRRILIPPTWVLSITIALVGAVTLVGIVLSVLALQTATDQAARTEAQAAKQEAIQVSVCRTLDVFRVKPGDSAPTTARGIEQAEAVEEEFRRLGCR